MVESNITQVEDDNLKLGNDKEILQILKEGMFMFF